MLADLLACLQDDNLDKSNELDTINAAWYVMTVLHSNLVLPKEIRMSILTLPSPMRWPEPGIVEAYRECVGLAYAAFRTTVGSC